ncbi:DNA polymerase III subunit epsilon [Vibrio jasicida]|uniref:DNA polymerase III subunit epsilon n=2 Tax=Vibrio jasicida TaxID=766224 RepID=A0AAU9QR18_9VIBR|nr:DNA polymerase III subunit epsilon [Vibrio jasicida]CAH1599421.1 DNA polymerase III subunit epsilon [Vibrio jasicida]
MTPQISNKGLLKLAMSETKDSFEQSLADACRNSEAYGVTRLRDQFGLKPAPNQKPHKFVKSPYSNRSNPIYLVSGCIPIRRFKEKELQKLTERQIRGRKLSGLKAKRRSRWYKASKLLAEFIENRDVLVLDTETTCVSNDAQVIELSIMDRHGNEVFYQRYSPTVPISEGAFNANGISLSELEECPSWDTRSDEVKNLLCSRPVLIFNSKFDLRLIKQSCIAFGCDELWVDNVESMCLMYKAAEIYGATNKYGSISLKNAVAAAGIEWQGKAHTATVDTRMTIALLDEMVRKHHALDQEIQKIENNKI